MLTMQSLTQLAGCCEALSDHTPMLETALPESWHVEATRERCLWPARRGASPMASIHARRLRTA